MKTVDFKKAPLILIWEVTQACELVCSHCRAEAIDVRHPDELTLEEGKRLLDQTAAMGTPVVVFSGGNPVQRDDLEDLIRYARACRLRTGTIPAATDRLTLERVKSLKAAGLDQMALSLDGSNAKSHDSFRGVPGSFEKTLRGARYAAEAGLPLQINTCFGSFNFHEFEAITELVESLGIIFWEVFFLVPTGRGSGLRGLDSDEMFQVFEKLHTIQQKKNFIVKITEAPFYRRFMHEKMHGGPNGAPQVVSSKELARVHLGAGKAEVPRSIRMVTEAVNSGKGFCFVSHTGEVFPSGFLPISAGNVRDQDIADIYRNSQLFRELRDASLLKGYCADCDFKEVCSGSRSRAHALTGDYLAEDPSCPYETPAVTSQ